MKLHFKMSFLIFWLLNALVSAEESLPPLVKFQPSIHRYGLDLLIYKEYVRASSTQNGKLLTLCEKLYHHNLIPEKPKETIPKVIHQIWLGGPVPKKFEEIMKTWMHWHGWEYRLWKDQDAADFPMINRTFFNALSNFGAKSDLLRYEILYQEGGLYVDIDFECLNAAFFDWANNQYDFYAGIETLKGCPGIHICNALMGCKVGHPLIKQLIDKIGSLSKIPTTGDIVDTTGPGLISKQFLEYYHKPQGVDTLDILFTPTYFYPLSKSDFVLKEKKMKKLLREESAALHHWTGTWLKGIKTKNHVKR